MNKVILMGRLTRNPEIMYSQGEKATAVARFTLAVDRRIKRSGDSGANADFISCVAFGKNAEFVEKYFHQGLKVAIAGHIQTGSYTNKDGQKVYTTDVVLEEQEFAESKGSSGNAPTANTQSNAAGYGQNNGYPQVPPSGNSYPQAAPANNGYPQVPPAGNNYPQVPPAGNNYPQVPPAGNNYPQAAQANNGYPGMLSNSGDGFMDIPEGLDEDLPFN